MQLCIDIPPVLVWAARIAPPVSSRSRSARFARVGRINCNITVACPLCLAAKRNLMEMQSVFIQPQMQNKGRKPVN